MDESQEDIFSEVTTLSSAMNMENGDSVRLSRFTIYHSAADFDEAMAQELRNRENRQEKPIMFRDHTRTVDFVLAWVEGKGGISSLEMKREAFEKHLEDEGLQLEREVTDRLHVVKLHAPKDVLRRYCEILKLRMPMKEISGQEELFRSQYDLMTEVKSFFSKLMNCVKLDTSVFPPQKFRLSAEYSRHKSYLFDEDSDNFFSSQVKTIVVDFILERTSFSLDTQTVSEVGIQKLISDGVYRAAYPLHDGPYENPDCLRGLLWHEWAQIRKWAMYQPIDQIRDYFGVKFALYFAWLGFYTHMLVPASIIGILCFIYGCITVYSDTLSEDICNEELNITMCPLCDRTCDYWKLSDTCTYARFTYLFDNPATIIFAIFMSFWATLFLELWKRYSASIAHRWGLTDFCLQSEPPRPQYLARLSSHHKSRYRTNVVTGTKEPYVPFWNVRLPAIMLSFSVVFLLVMVAVSSVFGVVLYRMSVLASVSLVADKEWAANYALVIIPATAAVINLVFILILNYFYDKVAVYLTELELLRTQTEFDESLTVKIYLFQFVNYYTSIMYIAFLKGKFVGYPAKYNRIFGLRQEECNPGGCLMELCIQLAVIMVGQQTMNGAIEMTLPFIYKWVNTLSIKAGLEKKSDSDDVLDPTHKQWTEDYQLLDYGPRGLFYEYLEMVMQYGFVTIFVSAFPLAPFFALLNNILEMRLDARKFLMFYRRPVPRQAPNIGVWFRILNVLGRLAVISNAFIIAFSSNFIPRLVYKMTVSEDHTDVGFLNHSLAVFNTADFAAGTAPRFPSYNVTTCRYSAYRTPPEGKYKRTALYWHVLAARLAFIVIFQNVVSVVMIAVQWCIPDVSPKLKDQIKREAYLTSELIIQHETLRARKANSDVVQNNEMVDAEKGEFRRRHVDQNEVQIDVTDFS